MSSDSPQLRERLAGLSMGSALIPRVMREQLLASSPSRQAQLRTHLRSEIEEAEHLYQKRRVFYSIRRLEEAGLELPDEFLEFLIDQTLEEIQEGKRLHSEGRLGFLLLELTSLQEKHLVRYCWEATNSLAQFPDELALPDVAAMLKCLVAHPNAGQGVFSALVHTHPLYQEEGENPLPTIPMVKTVLRTWVKRSYPSSSPFYRDISDFLSAAPPGGLKNWEFAHSLDVGDQEIQALLMKVADPDLLEPLLDVEGGEDVGDIFTRIAQLDTDRAFALLRLREEQLLKALTPDDLTPLLTSSSGPDRKAAFDVLARLQESSPELHDQSSTRKR